ncbi:MAG: rod shape-determining protein MreC [Pseudomonadales bacterium]
MLVTVDVSTRLLEPFRSVVGTLVSPLQIIAESPYLAASEVGEVFSSRDNLQAQNAALRQRVLELTEVAQQYQSLKTENERLRGLLGSRARLPAQVLVAELVGVVPSPNTFQVIIDKGSAAGVAVGHAVIDAHGLFGQIVEVDRYTSRVLLIVDTSHAVPVQVNRNGVRSIAGGTGRLDVLELENVPVTADIREGDLLESSGLGGRFPRGYPVGYVTSTIVDQTHPYARVTVRPLAQLDRSRHVLVVFDPEQEALQAEAMLSDDVHSAGDPESQPPPEESPGE